MASHRRRNSNRNRSRADKRPAENPGPGRAGRSASHAGGTGVVPGTPTIQRGASTVLPGIDLPPVVPCGNGVPPAQIPACPRGKRAGPAESVPAPAHCTTCPVPLNQVVCADNLAFMAGLPDACCQIIYADPPFFSGRTHVRAEGKHSLDDCWPGGLDSYLGFLRPRIEEMRRLLADSGVLSLHLDWHASHHGRVLLDRIFGDECFLNEIIWSYRTGGVAQRWFGRKHDTIYVYARRPGGHKFNPLREGTFRTDGMNYDEQGRPYKNTKAGRLYFNAAGPAVTDVWEIPFLSTVSRERTGYPAQKPEALLCRLINAFSDPGDLVADFFCGSGTTLAAARGLGRKFLGCDSSPQAVRLVEQRLGETLF